MCGSRPKPPPTPPTPAAAPAPAAPAAAPAKQLGADLAEAVTSSGKEKVKKRKGDRNALRIDAPSGGSANGLNIPQQGLMNEASTGSL